MVSRTPPPAALISPRHSSEARRFGSLPAELVSRILCLLGPRDVVHLRLVSKLFHDITFDPLIWKTIYSNACLPRPPGPFPSQSARFLERTLIRSERLARCWTTHPIQTISSTQIRLQGSSLGHPRIIGGRWLITFESYRQIVFYDIETRARQVLWEDAGLITAWDACSVMSAGGLLVYVVLRKDVNQEILCTPWKLLEFKVHDESGHLSHSASIDVPTKLYWQSVCLVADKTPFIYIMGRHLIFDTRTRTFYEFPEFASGIDGIETHQYLMSHRRVLLTSTHIVVVSYPLHQVGMPSSPAAESTLVQTFVLPPSPQNNQETVGIASGWNAESQSATGILRLSHEGMTPDRLANLVLIRNSIIDPATDATQLRFLRLQSEGEHLRFSCIDIALPSASTPGSFASSDGRDPNGRTPLMDIRLTEVFTVRGGVYDPSMSPCGYLIEASEDGYARGCCRNRVVESGVDLSSCPSTPSPWFTNFAIDATGEECVAILGRASPPLWAQHEGGDGSGAQGRLHGPPSFSTLSFDGVVGRFCYLKSGDGDNNWRMHGCVDVVVADIR